MLFFNITKLLLKYASVIGFNFSLYIPTIIMSLYGPLFSSKTADAAWNLANLSITNFTWSQSNPSCRLAILKPFFDRSSNTICSGDDVLVFMHLEKGEIELEYCSNFSRYQQFEIYFGDNWIESPDFRSSSSRLGTTDWYISTSLPKTFIISIISLVGPASSSWFTFKMYDNVSVIFSVIYFKINKLFINIEHWPKTVTSALKNHPTFNLSVDFIIWEY